MNLSGVSSDSLHSSVSSAHSESLSGCQCSLVSMKNYLLWMRQNHLVETTCGSDILVLDSFVSSWSKYIHLVGVIASSSSLWTHVHSRKPT